MEKQEFSFLSADGKTSIHAAAWIPGGPRPGHRGTLSWRLGTHSALRTPGLLSHPAGFCRDWTRSSGHGSSVIPGAPRLYLGPPGNWETATRDLDTCRRLARERFGRLPLFLLGHSMGSFLARTYLIRYPGTVDGAILVGTGQMSPAVLAARKHSGPGRMPPLGRDADQPLGRASGLRPL